MPTFYFNRDSGESIDSQWARYLQTNAYVTDVGTIIAQNRQELQSSILNASDEQKKAFMQICGRIEDGFDEINLHLKDIGFNISEIRGEINAMASMLDWRLSQMVESQRLTNNLLGNIAELLRIPESQKERVYFIENGLKYLKNAIIEGADSTFYNDALEEFQKAEGKERKDYILLNRIGQIYLYSKKHMNIPLARDYFLRSAREASAEDIAYGTTTSKYLRPDKDSGTVYEKNPFRSATAEAYLYASRACYLMHDSTEAANLASKAYALIPDFLEAGFENAKYLCATNREGEAAEVLENVINKDRLFAPKALEDQDIITKQPILKMIEKLQQITISKANAGLKECKKFRTPDSKAERILKEIQDNIKKNSFLSGMKALDLLNADYKLPIKVYSQTDSHSIDRRTTTQTTKLIEFIKMEYDNEQCFQELKKKIKDEMTIKKIFFWGSVGAIIGFVNAAWKSAEYARDFISWPTFMNMLVFSAVGSLLGKLLSLWWEPTINER